MLKRKKRESTEVNASSMADIAFLLLIFFLVTTTIASDKGLPILLPPEKDPDQPVDIEIQQRNLFKVIMNSNDQLLVEDEPMEVSEIKEECKKFLTNYGKDPLSSDSPQKAVTSVKVDRGTSYELYIDVMDELKAAYHETRADFVGITVDEYLDLDKKNPRDKQLYDKARKEFPLQISEAEPTEI